MNKFFNKILGSAEKYPLKHRIANAVILIGILLGIQSAVFNYLLNLPVITVTATLLTSVVLIIAYYLSRIKGYFHFPVYLSLFISILIYTPVMWIGNGGSAGGFQYYIFIYSTFVIAVIANRKVLLSILTIILTISISLLVYEYTFPERIFEYPGAEDRLWDLIISFSSVLIGVSALFFVYTNQYSKTNLKLKDKNIQLEEHFIEVEAHKNKIEDQRMILETQNLHINESISYAQKIQKAVLSSYDIIKKNTLDSFILYLPKEKISGDFYYFIKKNDLLITVIADSTGHGVPGGLMSMLGITMMEEIINNKEINDAASALNLFREKVIISLDQQNTKTVTNDGFDVSVCIINTKSHQINYAGANIPLVIIRNKTVLYYEPDNMPVGIYIDMKPFKNNYLQLKKDDSIYLFTDGIIDQFGGDKLQKYSFKRLQNILIKHSDESFLIQKEKIKKSFRNWKGSQKRTDDSLILGLKVF